MNQDRLRVSAALIGTALIAVSPAPAAAQDVSSESRDWIVSIGPGVRVGPDYPGADSYGFSFMPVFDLRREGEPMPIEAPDEGAGFGFLGDDSAFDFGPTLSFQGKRDEDDVGAPVGEVDFTVEAGAFAQVFIGDSFRFRVEGRRGIGGHDGWVGDLMADFVLRDDDDYVFTIGPRARWANDTYHEAYFGVTPAVATAAGISAFDPDGGFYAVGAQAGLKYRLGRTWGLYAFAGYDRLIGDAADSPIVRAFGSRDQFTGGIGIFFDINVGRLFGS